VKTKGKITREYYMDTETPDQTRQTQISVDLAY